MALSLDIALGVLDDPQPRASTSIPFAAKISLLSSAASSENENVGPLLSNESLFDAKFASLAGKEDEDADDGGGDDMLKKRKSSVSDGFQLLKNKNRYIYFFRAQERLAVCTINVQSN